MDIRERNERLNNILKRYKEIEAQLELLTKEKEELRNHIKLLLTESENNIYNTRIDNEVINISLINKSDIKYDESMLKERLGDKYYLILKPNIVKIRKNLSEIESFLAPCLDKIGSPSRDIIKERIGNGEFSISDFKGSFKKVIKSTLYVKKRMVCDNKFDGNTPY
ncbi:MAG: hypothetical protein HQK63_07935 [Desulfamplus sp.]|nr:hypothetical protein [Desulfamplus sp.]